MDKNECAVSLYRTLVWLFDSIESTGNLMEKEGIQIIEDQIFDAEFSIEIL
jgi:hypothetical protein